MTRRGPTVHWSIFAVAGLLLGIAAKVGFDANAKVVVAGYSTEAAIQKAFANFIDFPISSSFLAAPFAGAVLLAREALRRGNLTRACLGFGFAVLILSWLYWSGFIGAEQAMAERKWTAASLSVGFLIFYSVPVLLIAAIFAGGLTWRLNPRDDA